jgi:hypothetical protein
MSALRNSESTSCSSMASSRSTRRA